MRQRFVHANVRFTQGEYELPKPLIPVPDLKATNSFSRISDSGDLLRISSRLIQIWYQISTGSERWSNLRTGLNISKRETGRIAIRASGNFR